MIDRFSKLYVVGLNGNAEGQEKIITSFLSINLIRNEGIAFGLLSSTDNFFYNSITVLILILIIYILVMCFKSKGIERYFYILICGGALGNFYDRVFYNSVPDFIDLHYKEFNWFIFNIADIFITIGIICLIINEIYFNKSSNE